MQFLPPPVESLFTIFVELVLAVWSYLECASSPEPSAMMLTKRGCCATGHTWNQLQWGTVDLSDEKLFKILRILKIWQIKYVERFQIKSISQKKCPLLPQHPQCASCNLSSVPYQATLIERMDRPLEKLRFMQHPVGPGTTISDQPATHGPEKCPEAPKDSVVGQIGCEVKAPLPIVITYFD